MLHMIIFDKYALDILRCEFVLDIEYRVYYVHGIYFYRGEDGERS